MSRIDYGQVPACEDPDVGPYYTQHVYASTPEHATEFDKGSEKWIPADHLNTIRTFTPGSKALVGIRETTGKWGIIKVREAI